MPIELTTVMTFLSFLILPTDFSFSFCTRQFESQARII